MQYMNAQQVFKGHKNFKRSRLSQNFRDQSLYVTYHYLVPMVPLDGTFGWYLWMAPLDGTFGWYLWMVPLDGTFGWYLWMAANGER